MTGQDAGPVTAGRLQLAPIYAAGFVTAFGAHAVAANLGRYALGRHASLWELGLLLGIYDGAEVVLKPVFGALADRKGAKPVMAGGLVVFAAASAAFVAGGDPHLLGAARLAQGAAAAAFSPAASAAVAAFGGKKRTGRLFGGYGGAKGAGYLAGPVAGGALVAAGGYPLLFGVLSAVALIAAAAVAALVPHVAVAARRRPGVGDLARHLAGADFLRPVLLLAAATAALSAGVGFLPVLGARHQLGPLATGALVSLLAAVAAVLQPWAGRRLDAGRLRPAAGPAALIVCAAGFLTAIAAPGAAGIAAAAVLVGAGVAVATPLGFTLLAAGAPPGRLGRTMGAPAVPGREDSGPAATAAPTQGSPGPARPGCGVIVHRADNCWTKAVVKLRGIGATGRECRVTACCLMSLVVKCFM
jgi:MFS transporter, DHA1 family, tetracycline resistance protein